MSMIIACWCCKYVFAVAVANYEINIFMTGNQLEFIYNILVIRNLY